MTDAQPSSGWLEGREHVLPVRIYYEDTDFTGVVYHANYLRYFERGRSDFLRLAGISHQSLLDLPDPAAFTVTHIAVDFKRAARIDDALLVRYPNRATHDKERSEALTQITVVRQAALNRVKELERQRKELDTELEFYAKDPEKIPPSLRRLVDDNEKSMAVQERFIADQEAEMVRVNARFDEELQRLQQLWAQIGAPAN